MPEYNFSRVFVRYLRNGSLRYVGRRGICVDCRTVLCVLTLEVHHSIVCLEHGHVSLSRSLTWRQHSTVQAEGVVLHEVRTEHAISAWRWAYHWLLK